MTQAPTEVGTLLVKPNNFWGLGQFTYSIPTAGSLWAYPASAVEPTGTGYGVLNAAQIVAFEAAIAAWDKLIAPNFVKTDDVTSPGNIRVAFTDVNMTPSGTSIWGFAFAPAQLGLNTPNANPPIAGDIWINATEKTSPFVPGDYDFGAMIHEIGHALGLSHPHDVPGFPTTWDSDQWTVMSYEDKRGVVEWRFAISGGSLLATPNAIYAETPMVLDIQAIQNRYGADPTTATGDTVYSFGTGRILRAIYDAGGADTIDASAHSRSSIIDLNPGAYSSIGRWTIAEQIAHWQALFPQSASFIAGIFNNPINDPYTFEDNLGIAFSTTIENAKGGSGADEISGNAVSNRLEGGGGADKLFGLAGDDFLIGDAGNDILDGGAGTDIAIYGTASTSATWTQGAGGWTVNAGGFGVDTLTGIEILRFADRDVALAALGPGINGGTGNDILAGTISDEAINGLAGDDQITGAAGADTLDGGAGVDTAVFSGNRITYTITKVGTGGTITGPDGTDTIINIEWLKFGDQTIRFRPGNGTSVNINDPASYAANLRDFDGNNLGSASGWKLIGATDIQKDGDIEHILVNQALGRWASVGPAEDGLVYFGDHGWAGDTRVVGIYTDPLVQSGQVAQGGPFDSQRRFANDLTIGNIKGVLGGGDYDKDGFQEVYFSLSDGSAFLHAYMHADGNIRYANYQSQQQVIDFLTANGFSSSTWAGWFGP